MNDHHPNIPEELDHRLAEVSPQEREAYQKTWDLALLGRQVDEAELPDMQTIWKNLAPALEESPQLSRDQSATTEPKRVKARLYRLRYIAVAASLLAGALLISWWSIPITYEAPIGERLIVSLPDGSTAELNSGARISYRRPLLAWNRAVKLDGEAFFDVVKEDRQFVVETFNASVAVLGTTFNVRAWEKERVPETAVLLVTGSVRFYSLNAPDTSILLEPGEMARLVDGSTVPEGPITVSDTEVVWRSGGLAFDGLPLYDLLDELERRYDIQLNADPSLVNHDLTLYLSSAPAIETVLDLICNSIGCRIESASDGKRFFLGTIPSN